MISISIPPNFSPEREYIVEVFFKRILKVPFTIQKTDISYYLINLPNGKSIQIVDHFFAQISDTDDYLKKINLPKNVRFLKNKYSAENDVPVFLEPSIIDKKGVCNTDLFLDVDIFGSAFFILTRFEEYLVDNRDEHGRYLGKNSIAYINKFLHRPIVNEYAELLWNMILELGYDLSLRKYEGYKIIPSHDIDKVYYTPRLQFLLGDLLLDKSIRRAFKRISLPRENYWDTFSWIMDVSEENNLKSIFYLMSDSENRNDSQYSLNDNFIKTKIDEMKSRGHIIGFHPGYDTVDNFEEWNRQKELLENSIGQKIEETRQHFLRFQLPNTINIIDQAGVKIDSTLGYSDKIGFRCGTSCEYPLFDIVNRRVTNVIERPLIIMDIILRDRKNTEASAQKSIEILNAYKETCKRYNIPLTLLFHNSSFDPIRWNTWKEAYKEQFIP